MTTTITPVEKARKEIAGLFEELDEVSAIIKKDLGHIEKTIHGDSACNSFVNDPDATVIDIHNRVAKTREAIMLSRGEKASREYMLLSLQSDVLSGAYCMGSAYKGLESILIKGMEAVGEKIPPKHKDILTQASIAPTDSPRGSMITNETFVGMSRMLSMLEPMADNFPPNIQVQRTVKRMHETVQTIDRMKTDIGQFLEQAATLDAGKSHTQERER